MTVRCEVCGQLPLQGSPRSFFPWPTDSSQRTYWQTCLGLQVVDLNKSDLFICSDHFDSMQMIRKGTALRKDAFPKRYMGPLPIFAPEDESPKIETLLDTTAVKNEDGIFGGAGPSAPIFDDEEIMPEELSMAKLVQMFAAAAKERPPTIVPLVTPIAEETKAFSNILIDRQEKYLNSYCKSCLRQAELVNMLEANCEGVPVSLMYKTVFMSEINGTEVPQMMCATCIGLLFQCFKFSTMTVRSCEVLQAARERFKYLPAIDDGTIDLKNIPQKYSAKSSAIQPVIQSDGEDTKEDITVAKKRKSVVKAKEVPEKKGRRTSSRKASEKAKKVSKKILEESEDEESNDIFDNDDADPDFDTAAYEVKDESPEVSEAEEDNKEGDNTEEDPEDNYCMLCRHSFSNMVRHMDKVHRVDWESKSCERCQTSFDFPEQLFSHLKSENHDIACKNCHAEFKDDKSYKKHLKSLACEKNRLLKSKSKVKTRKPLKPQNEEVKEESEIKDETSAIEITTEDFMSVEDIDNLEVEKPTKPISKKKFKYICNKCDMRCNVFKEMFDHLKDRHSGTLNCIFCKERFQNEVQLLDHVGEHSKSFYCRIHFIAFKTRSELKSHYKLPNHQFECGICDKTLKSRSARYAHRRRHLFPEEEAKCPHCPLVYRHYPNLARHIKTFHMEKTYLCEQCGVSYSTNHALKIHVERDHVGVWEKKAADLCCEDCGKTFKYIKDLRMHKATHLGHSEFCRHCHESFENMDKLTEHMKDKGHELFTCDQCSQTFVRRGVYLLHLEKHKYSGDERMKKKLNPTRRKTIVPSSFKCIYCQKEFRSKIQMKEHARMHSDDKPFKCNVCGKCFKRGPTLYAHKRVHLDYKKYRCKFCEKRFTQPGGLAQHIMIHTGERPHKCEICGKGFITTTSLKKHLETHRKANHIMM